MFVENHNAFLLDFGVDVARDSLPTFRALFDAAEADAFGTGTVTDRTLMYPASDLATPLANGELLTIDGATYKVASEPRRRVEDGVWMVAKVVLV